jgi:hypothetical protein
MKRITLALFAGILALSGLAVTAGAASADTAPIPDPVGGSVRLTVDDVRYGADGGCRNAPVRISVQTPDDYAYMEYDFESTYDGPTSLADWVSSSGEGFSGVFTDSFVVCPEYDSPGTYYGRLNVRFYDYEYNVIAETDATDVFHVLPRLHTSSIAASRATYGAHGWALKATARYDGHAWRNKTVKLQRYAGHNSWTTLRSVRTNRYGKATLGFTPANRTLRGYRVLLPASNGAPNHVSSTHWLRRR